MKKFLVFEKITTTTEEGDVKHTYGKLISSYDSEFKDDTSTNRHWLEAEPKASHFELPEGMEQDCVRVRVIDGIATLIQNEKLVLEKRQRKANSVLEEIRQLREPLLKDADFSINRLEDDGLDSTLMRAYRKALKECTENLKELSREAKLSCENLVPSEFEFPTKPTI